MDSDILMLKVLYTLVNVPLIIVWLIASAFNKASIGEMDLDPEEMEEPDSSDDNYDDDWILDTSRHSNKNFAYTYILT